MNDPILLDTHIIIWYVNGNDELNKSIRKVNKRGMIMPYLIYALDDENMQSKREEIRDAHREHLRSAGKKLLASGALLAEDGKTVIGGISLLDTDDYNEAKKFAFDDPYQKANIRKETIILKWRKRWWEGKFLG